MENNNVQTAKDVILHTMNLMGFSDAQIYERQEEDRLVFNIKCGDAKLLIGKQGSTLESLQYVLKLLVNRKLGEADRFFFAIDIDDYKEKRVVYLKDLARKAAQQVKTTKKAVSLVPMPSHERRVIHNYLSLYTDIESTSTGVDPERKLIIKYKKPQSSGFTFIEEM